VCGVAINCSASRHLARYARNLYQTRRVSLDVRVLWTVLPGVSIIVFAFTEIFQDLFHPTHTGSLSDWIGRSLFRLFRRWPSALSTAGPLTIVLVILCWALLQVLGFALIYWAAFPNGYRLLNRQDSAGMTHGFSSMLYFSFQVMTTLWFGDVMPRADWLRIVTSLQALIGFALLTASVSSIVLIYPALGRMRLLARRTTILERAAKETGVDVISGDVENLLGDLANAVIQTRVDLIHFPIIYYFHSDYRRSSLAAALPKIMDFAKAGSIPDAPERVRLAAATLRAALQDLAALLDDRFLHTKSKEPGSVFRAYAKDHVIREMQPD
jgi:Ion channel